MWILSRHIFREVATGAFLGTVLFTFVLFLQKLGRLFEQLVTSSASVEQVAGLFLLILPQTLPFTIPVGVLTGVLITMGRMSGDAEIIALRAAGVPSRRVIWPVVTFGFLGMLVAAYASCILTPWATRETFKIINQMGAAQVTAEIQARVFEEQFPNRVLFVEDVVPGPVVKWRHVFMADLRPPSERDGAGDRGDGPRLTLAAEAIALPDLEQNRIQLSLRNGSNFEVGKEAAEYYASSYPKGDQALDAPQPKEKKAKDYTELEMAPLWEQAATHVPARIEFHQRLSLPVACLVLSLLAVPLGISSRKGGKSAAFVITVGLAFLYFMGHITLVGLARQGTLPVGIALWTPNLVFACLALILVAKLERPGDRDWATTFKLVAEDVWRWLRRKLGGDGGMGRGFRLPLLPQIIDTYVLTTFLYYFLVCW
ncbi:MAG: LptF/LptG family permease [Bryobacteraceae bacterium]|nr:LptF/LptG family permease [Bryobacteraceae bacterium]